MRCRLEGAALLLGQGTGGGLSHPQGAGSSPTRPGGTGHLRGGARCREGDLSQQGVRRRGGDLQGDRRRGGDRPRGQGQPQEGGLGGHPTGGVRHRHCRVLPRRGKLSRCRSLPRGWRKSKESMLRSRRRGGEGVQVY